MVRKNSIADVAKDLVVILDDRPGELLRLARILGAARINIHGMMALTGQGKSVVHLLVSEPDRAVLALDAAQLKPKAARHILILNVPDRPDALAAALDPLARAAVNIEMAYLTVGSRSETRVVLVLDDIVTARQVLGQPAP